MEGDFRIGDWLVQPLRDVIESPDQSVQLEPKAMDLLVYLAEYQGEVIPKERLIQAVWPDAFVTDEVLTNNIWKLRQAFGDEPKNPKFIQTVPRRGYQLIAEVVWEHASEEKAARYEIGEKIGQGAMGEVYIADDTLLKRKVALKFVREEIDQEVSWHRRLVREARSAAALDHPFICKVYDTGQLEGRIFIAMEYVKGESLKALLKEGPLPLDQALQVAREAAEALETAHDKGLVHRDIKPSNIMLAEQGHVKLMDFGVAKRLRPAKGEEQDWTGTLTGEGSTLGTPPYMSPEQVRGQEVDSRSDIFSLGVVLYEILTGVHPFRKQLSADTAAAILDREPGDLARYIEDIPELLQDTISKLLAKDPEERYQSAHEVRTSLTELSVEITRPAAAVVTLRKSQPGIPRILALVGLFLVVITLIATGIWFFGPEKVPALTEQDEILITDFVNTTGDKVFDGALKTALRVKLDESPYLNIVSDSALRESLGYMERPPDTRITPEIGREICQRRGNKAVMIGEITRLGSTYLITLNAENCQTGDLLAQTQAEATSKEEVLRALDSSATTMRQRLGESLALIEKVNTRLSVTTTSLEALKAFNKAREMSWLYKHRDGIAFAQRAVELDPDLARAHSTLANLHANVGESTRARVHAKRAYELREQASELEQFGIEEAYHVIVTEDLDKAIQVLEMATKTYPDKDLAFWNNLAGDYSAMGQHEKALECQLLAADLPTGRTAAGRIVLEWRFRNLGRFSEAKATLETAISEGLENAEIHRTLYELAFLEGDETAMQRHADWVEAHPDDWGGMEWIRIDEAYISGRLQKARRLLEDWVLILQQQNRDESAAGSLAGAAWWESITGCYEQAQVYARKALEIAPSDRSPRQYAAFALAATGATEEAEKIVASVSEEAPESTLWHGRDLPTVQANIELWKGNPEKAVELLRPAKRFEVSGSACILTRGRAFLALKRGEEAATEFQKILDHRGITGMVMEYPAAIVGLARAKVLMSDETGARKSYEEFLTMWKDADTDVPLLKEAKAEYERLTQKGQ